MAFLGGLIRGLRNDIDQVGSFFTGQPAHSAPQAPPPPPPRPISQPQQIQMARPNVPSLSVQQAHPPQLAIQQPSTPNVYKPTPLPVHPAPQQNLAVDNQIVKPSPLVRTPTVARSAYLQSHLNPSIGQYIANNWRQKFNVPLAAAEQVGETAQNFITRPLAELNASRTGNTFNPSGTLGKTVFGNTPIQPIQQAAIGVQQHLSQSKNPIERALATPAALGDVGLHVAQDVPVVGGLVKGGAKAGEIGIKAADEALHPTFAGLKPPQIIMDTGKLDTLNTARQMLTTGNKNPTLLNVVNHGLHQIKNDHGLDFITGSPADRNQRITQFLEQNGEAIPQYQNYLAKPRVATNEVGAVGKNVQPEQDPLAALKQEALKYKSADEFHQAQMDKFYGPSGDQKFMGGLIDKYKPQLNGKNSIEQLMTPAERTRYNSIKNQPQVADLKDLYNQAHAEAKGAVEPNVAETIGDYKPKGKIILKETAPHGGKQDVITIRKNPKGTDLIPQQESITTPKAAKMAAEDYANTFGITKMQAEKDLREMAAQSHEPKATENELAQMGPGEKLSVKQRRELIQNDPRQQTVNQLELNPTEGSAKSAIANAMALSEERDARLAEAQRLGKKLDEHDKALLDRYDAGENIDDLAKEAHNPTAFVSAGHTIADALDYSLAAGRTSGAATLRQHNYIPHNYEVSEEWLNAHKIPEDQRIKIGDKVRGFRDIHAKYGSYAEAAKSGLKPLYPNRIEDVADYAKGGSYKIRNNLLQSALAKAMPDDIAPIDTTYMNGQKFKPAAGGNLPFAASEKLDKQLQGFRQAWSPNTKAGRMAEGAIRLSGSFTKKSLFWLSAFHQAHIAENVAFASALGGEPRAIAENTINEFKTTGGLSKTSYFKVMDKYRQDGTLDYARRMGIKFEGNSALGRFVDVQAIGLAKAAARGGIKAGSQEAVDLGTIYNRLLGRENSLVEAHNPTLDKMTSYFALAPHYLRTQLRLVTDALLPKKLGGAGYDRALKITSPGGAARAAVLGPRALGALTAITASAIVMHHFPTWEDAKREAGLQLNNVNPNIKIKSKNAKGEGQVMNLPTDPVGLALGFVTDPKHFFQSRYSPVLSFGTKVATNTNWNGQPLSDTNKPLAQQLGQRAKNAAINSFVPIGIQNFTNLQHNQNNPSALQGAAQEVGLRLKTDPNDPQVQAQKQYFNQLDKYGKAVQSGNFSAVNPALSNVDPKLGAYWAAQLKSYQDLNPGKDITGVENSSQWNALSSAQKASYMLMNDPKTGAQSLSPIYYIQQQLAQQDPNRPHSPLYDPQMLDQDGVTFTLDKNGNVVGDNSATRAQIALDYQAQPATSDQKALMLAANPWLSDYEKAVGQYSANYKPAMTQYMRNQGWSQGAINDYWTKHPDQPAPIQNNITPDQQKLLDSYYAINDPTQQEQFYTDNAKELTIAFANDAIYKNQKAVAQGALPDQLHPVPNANAAAGLALLKSNPNHDKAISKYNALLIKNNPDLNQYLADSGLFKVAKDAARYQYQDPAHPGLSATQLINLGRPIDQATLKGISTLGAYDIGKNANGQYAFMGAGGTGQLPKGYSSGSGFGHSKHKRAPMFHMRRAKRIKIKHPHKQHKVFLNKPPSPVKIKNRANDHVGIKSKTYL